MKQSNVPYAHGEGYLVFIGYLQLIAGVLTVMFSAMTVFLAMAVDPSPWVHPIEIARSFGPADSGVLAKLIAGYIAFQFTFGWIFGLSMILSRWLCLRHTGRRVVGAIAVLNLLNFPHGTTVAILVLHGLMRPGIAGAFRRSKEN